MKKWCNSPARHAPRQKREKGDIKLYWGGFSIIDFFTSLYSVFLWLICALAHDIIELFKVAAHLKAHVWICIWKWLQFKAFINRVACCNFYILSEVSGAETNQMFLLTDFHPVKDMCCLWFWYKAAKKESTVLCCGFRVSWTQSITSTPPPHMVMHAHTHSHTHQTHFLPPSKPSYRDFLL